MNNEFHKPFLNSLIIVALLTGFCMVSTRLLLLYAVPYNDQIKNVEYSSQTVDDPSK